MGRYRHQDGTNNEHYNVHLQSPFAANTLSNYAVLSVSKETTK